MLNMQSTCCVHVSIPCKNCCHPLLFCTMHGTMVGLHCWRCVTPFNTLLCWNFLHQLKWAKLHGVYAYTHAYRSRGGCVLPCITPCNVHVLPPQMIWVQSRQHMLSPTWKTCHPPLSHKHAQPPKLCQLHTCTTHCQDVGFEFWLLQHVGNS